MYLNHPDFWVIDGVHMFLTLILLSTKNYFIMTPDVCFVSEIS